MSTIKDFEVMLDLETMGTGFNAAVASIGAVKFNLKDGVFDEFYINVDVKDAAAHGLIIDPKTVEWWKQQSKMAQKAITKDPHPLKDALRGFSVWFGSKSVPVWGNGATFDNVIIRSAYEAVGMNPPWKFWHDRCFRTMKSVIVVEEPEMIGVKHNAVDDARQQARHLLKIYGS